MAPLSVVILLGPITTPSHAILRDFRPVRLRRNGSGGLSDRRRLHSAPALRSVQGRGELLPRIHQMNWAGGTEDRGKACETANSFFTRRVHHNSATSSSVRV